MRFPFRILSAAAVVAVGVAFFCGCEDSGGGDDVGDNNPDLVICVGDSITQGFRCDGAPYPTQLAAMCGKTVRNFGIGGARAGAGASRIKSQLSCKPGYVCIMYGSNDAIKGGRSSAAAVQESLRAIIAACKDNQSIPIVATIPPMVRGHDFFAGAVPVINEAIRSVAKEEGARLVDVNKAFGDGEAYLGIDGLHPNAAGAQIIAECFSGEL